MIKKKLFTIGYQGLTQDQFVDLVLNKGIKKIIDLRAVPLSRKKGFSKNKLEFKLNEIGLEYEHIESLGTPKAIREDFKTKGDFNVFTKLYLDAISNENITLNNLSSKVINSVCCLLCFEKTPSECHRSIVANEIVKRSKTPIQISHL
jgi:uncharacterized protein (DUF488 family)